MRSLRLSGMAIFFMLTVLFSTYPTGHDCPYSISAMLRSSSVATLTEREGGRDAGVPYPLDTGTQIPQFIYIERLSAK